MAAAGFVFSLRKMQTVWEKARTAWKGEVREEGRQALRRTEEGVRRVIEDGVGRSRGEIREMERVRGIVERVRRALAELEKDGDRKR